MRTDRLNQLLSGERAIAEDQAWWMTGERVDVRVVDGVWEVGDLGSAPIPDAATSKTTLLVARTALRNLMAKCHREFHASRQAGGPVAPADPGPLLTEEPTVVDLSIPKLRKALEDGSFDHMLGSLLASERAGKTRKGAVAAIEERIEAVS